MSFHLFDPQKSVRFVKASESSNLASNPNENPLNGDEIRQFYEEVISQPSTSTSYVKVKQEKIEVKKEPRRQQARPSNNEISERDKNLFFKAAEWNDLNSLVNYLKMGIDINLKDGFGWTPLMCASAGGSLESVELLLINGADYDYSLNGLDAEALAKKNKHSNVANLIANFRDAQNKKLENDEIEIIEEQYCPLCKLSHFDSKHETSIPHLVNLKEKPSEGYAYGIHMTNVGYQLLKKMDWTEGKGLGNDASGRKYPIRTALKKDKKGLGLDKKAQMKVTHFESMDEHATGKRPPRRTYIRQLDREVAKKKEKEYKLRRLLS